MRGAVQPRPLTPSELDDLMRRVPALAESLRSGDPQPAPDWFVEELEAARRRRTSTRRHAADS